MQKNIRLSGALERAGKFGGFRVEFRNCVIAKGGGGLRRVFDDEKLNVGSVGRPMLMQQPAESTDSANLRWKPRADDDKWPRAHVKATKREIVPQNFCVWSESMNSRRARASAFAAIAARSVSDSSANDLAISSGFRLVRKIAALFCFKI